MSSAGRAGDFGLFSITASCVNRGNLIIEHATRRVLGLEQPAVEIDAHHELTPEAAASANRCRAVVLPGATLLQPGDHAALERLACIAVPVLAIGSALRSQDSVPDLALARQIRTVVGSRDPFTHQALTAAGLESRLVGCPTLLLAAAPGWRPREGPIVYSCGLGDQTVLAACAHACAAVGPTVLLLHAPARQPACVEGPGVTAVPLDSAEQAIDLIRQASVVVTSRMHAYLVALIHGVPAVFLGGWYDSRYTLLEYLGVPLEPPVPARIGRLVAEAREGRRLPPDACFERADRLRAGMVQWLQEAAAPLGLGLRTAMPAMVEGTLHA